MFSSNGKFEIQKQLRVPNSSRNLLSPRNVSFVKGSAGRELQIVASITDLRMLQKCKIIKIGVNSL